MPTTHRGDEVGDNHSNWRKFQFRTSSGTSVDQGMASVNVDPDTNYTMTTQRSTSDGRSGPYRVSVSHHQSGYDEGQEYTEMKDLPTPRKHAGFKTEKRAQIAAESMVKRDMEGRDLKTGRQKDQ